MSLRGEDSDVLLSFFRAGVLAPDTVESMCGPLCFRGVRDSSEDRGAAVLPKDPECIRPRLGKHQDREDDVVCVSIPSLPLLSCFDLNYCLSFSRRKTPPAPKPTNKVVSM